MTREEALIKVFQEAQQRLIQTIAMKEARGNVTQYQESIIRQVRQILFGLGQYSNAWVIEAINESYSLGAAEALQGLDDMGVKVNGYEAFSRLHKASVEVLVANTQSQIMGGISFVGRQVEDTVRQAGLEAIAMKQATGSTVKEAAKIVKQKLIDQGLNAIKDKRGRMISLDAYADTVARSTTREATNTATMNQLQYEGYDLVKMSDHRSACPVCAKYEGRVYSISGNNRDYPRLSIPYSGGHANIHPKCRHVISPYIPALADDAEGDKEFSNRSFDVDSRSRKAIEAYNDRQKAQRQLRADRDQFQRYRLALGEDAPKTLSGFRRMKAADSDKYQQLQQDYRDFNKSVGQT